MPKRYRPIAAGRSVAVQRAALLAATAVVASHRVDRTRLPELGDLAPERFHIVRLQLQRGHSHAHVAARGLGPGDQRLGYYNLDV